MFLSHSVVKSYKKLTPLLWKLNLISRQRTTNLRLPWFIILSAHEQTFAALFSLSFHLIFGSKRQFTMDRFLCSQIEISATSSLKGGIVEYSTKLELWFRCVKRTKFYVFWLLSNFPEVQSFPVLVWDLTVAYILKRIRNSPQTSFL